MIAHFVLAGQSNIDQWFHVDDGSALESFKETFLALNPQYTDVQFFDAARGGSALLSGSALQYAGVRAPDDADLFERISQNYWYDETTGVAGPNLSLFLGRIETAVATGIEFLGIIWAQGEADTTYVGEHGGGKYTEALGFVLGQLADASNTPDVYIQALGDRAFYSERLHGGAEAIRDAQQLVADSSDAIALATTIFDLELRDSVHLTVAAYEAAAVRMAIAISTGETSPAVGEAILVDHNTILVQLQLAPDQRCSGDFDLGGFSIVENGVEIEITLATMTSSGLLRVQTLTELSSPNISYGAVENSVNMQIDDFIYVTGPNGSVPIFPFNLTVAQPSLETTEIGGRLHIEGDDLNNQVIGLSGDDYLYGNDGDDVLIGGWGRDRLYGGSGADTFVLSTDTSTDIVYDFDIAEDAIGLLGYSQANVTFRPYGDNDLDIRTPDGQRIVLRNVSYESADDIQIHMLGNEGSNDLIGSAGEDQIFAFGGDDWIDSGAGDDLITVGVGADTISFGTGSNTNTVYDFNVEEDTILLVDLFVTSLTVEQSQAGDLELRSPDGDLLVLNGVSLTDFALVNIVDQQPEVGILTGTDGNDVLRGSAVNDLVSGLGGTDRLYGEGGDDVFVFGAGSGLNVIYDFAQGQDKILIEDQGFDSLTIISYNTTDAEIRLASGERLVLRNIDHDTVDADDFVFSVPDEFI
ncbi:hemolysin type calcium-binding protein [Litoreibacter meonggei]|uniref:Hemolysin type calcium-binding protein n=1 Tax=Litoreibacter meonggei TaxID=1049199 RepID=A0A497VC41_9RHOB|nr:calcium-binding protein [Litoreibacter meonggei]RLJ41030.1 hemolysin type calcium-binding protein [Litoreibacter meonggei]